MHKYFLFNGVGCCALYIRSGSRVLKTWFGCQVAEQGTLLDLFNDFSAGKIDNSFSLSDTFSTASIECEIGRDKRVLTECYL